MRETYPRKSLGQHWLNDADTLEAIADIAEIGPQDVILEIGPGLGTLTQLLVRRAKKVFAVELRGEVEKLPRTVGKLNRPGEFCPKFLCQFW